MITIKEERTMWSVNRMYHKYQEALFGTQMAILEGRADDARDKASLLVSRARYLWPEKFDDAA